MSSSRRGCSGFGASASRATTARPTQLPCLPHFAVDGEEPLNATRLRRLKSGVPKFTPYQVRQPVEHRVDADGSLGNAQTALGYSPAQTSKRYAKRSFGRAARVARKRVRPAAN